MGHEQHNIVCISTIDWDFVWQGHQEIMSTLAGQGHRVLFIENTGVRRASLKDLPRLRGRLKNWRKGIGGIRKVMDNVYVYAPLVLPFPYSRAAKLVNRALVRWTLRKWVLSMRFSSPIVWTWLPTPMALDLIKFFDPQLTIYYCCDNFAATSVTSRWVRESEDLLLARADLVFAHSKALHDRCARIAKDVHVFQYGFNREVFSHIASEAPPDLARIPRPILGYVGGLHKHVDLGLLKRVAETYPDHSLVCVGPLQESVSEVARLPNVHFLGQKRYEELPSYIGRFDIGLIPYRLNDYTHSVYPNKLNEYLILGKPVISTKLPEVEYFNRCHRGTVTVAEDEEAFVRAIKDVLAQDSDECRAKRIEEVQANVWGQKIESMQRLIRAKLEEKSKSREVNWQETLVGMYRQARRKAMAVAGGCALLYALLFHTPLIWFVAEPLRTYDVPQPTDAIVVMAGGVGESGEASDAYQEKVQYGVELFRQGYAGTLVFSSGAHYVFKEAQVMRALAINLGVPEERIVLDEIGGGSYASVRNMQRMAQERGWRSLLIITSRYNTTRTKLAAKANLLGIAGVVVAPPRSIFFGEGQEVQLRHLHAIVHEYVAIAYYKMRRYV